jgi:hypothetical protein
MNYDFPDVACLSSFPGKSRIQDALFSSVVVKFFRVHKFFLIKRIIKLKF